VVASRVQHFLQAPYFTLRQDLHWAHGPIRHWPQGPLGSGQSVGLSKIDISTPALKVWMYVMAGLYGDLVLALMTIFPHTGTWSCPIRNSYVCAPFIFGFFAFEGYDWKYRSHFPVAGAGQSTTLVKVA